MGYIEITRRWVEEKRLILTDADWKLREERRERKQESEIGAKPLPYMEAFVRHLEKCPFCGKTPKIQALMNGSGHYYSIKLTCCEKDMLNCGDWYKQLSRAGLDWNYRVRHQRGEPLKTVPHRYRMEVLP